MIATPHPTMATQSATPWRGTLRAQPLVALATSEPANGAAYSSPSTYAFAVEALVDERREERDWHAEDHRDEVRDERALEHGAAAQVAKPFADGAQRHAVAARDRDRLHREHEADARRRS